MNALTIEVWSIALDASEEGAGKAARLLSSDEIDRAARFARSLHRRRWVLARAGLRSVLARYCGVAPEELRFRYDKNGKPWIGHPSQEGTPYFNLSHSEDLAMVGVTYAGPLGIDVEYRREIPDAETIMERHFAPSERKAIRALPRAQVTQAFYDCWTRKESYIKALGLGLAAPLDCFDVSVAPNEAPRVLSIMGDTKKARNWALCRLSTPPDYTAALAVRLRTPDMADKCHLVERGNVRLAEN